MLSTTIYKGVKTITQGATITLRFLNLSGTVVFQLTYDLCNELSKTGFNCPVPPVNNLVISIALQNNIPPFVKLIVRYYICILWLYKIIV